MRATFLLLLCVILAAGIAPAEEKKRKSKVPEDPQITEVEKEEAKKLAGALEKALKKKEEKEIIKAIEPMITKSSERFFKPLTKAAKNKSMSVRVIATKALGSQKEPAKKLGSTLYGLLKWKPNKSASPVLAMTIDSLRRQGYRKKPAVDEIESHFKKTRYANVMKACARYFGDLKMVDKVKMLVGWVEAPQPANVNSPTNPPASYWRRMWEIWNEIKETVWYSLEKITGKNFKTTREWRTWLRTPEAKKLGIR